MSVSSPQKTHRTGPKIRREIHFLAMPHAKSWHTQTCNHCYGVKFTRAGRPYLYSFTIDIDDPPNATNDFKLFCSQACALSASLGVAVHA